MQEIIGLVSKDEFDKDESKILGTYWELHGFNMYITYCTIHPYEIRFSSLSNFEKNEFEKDEIPK